MFEEFRKIQASKKEAEERRKQEEIRKQEEKKLQQQMATGQLDRPHKVADARRDLARLLTVRREAEIKAKAK